VVVPNHAAPALKPFDVNAVGDVPGEPDEENEDHAEGGGATDEIVSVLRRQRPGRERARTNQRQKDVLAERDVEPGKPEDDETSRGHPMHESFKAVEAYNLHARTAGLYPHHAAD